MPSQDVDLVAGPADRASARHGRATVVVVALVAALLGSGVTALALLDGPGPVRVFTAAGVPQQSLGRLVVPVEVVNAGRSPFEVQAVQPGDRSRGGLTFALVTDAVVVPAGEARELLVGVERDCPAVERLTAQDLRFAVVLEADGAVTAEPVTLSGGAAGALGIALRCEP